MSDIDEEELGERWKKFKKENWARTSYSNKFTECEKNYRFRHSKCLPFLNPKNSQ